MSKKNQTTKTNAMRILDSAGIDYKILTYDTSDGNIDGVSVAKKSGVPMDECYKTLVTKGAKDEHYVFVIPVEAELDLKKAAKHFGEKKIDMIHVKELLPLTGYVRGGCSPVGMKKLFLTCIEEKALEHDYISVSGGKIGTQVVLDPEELAMITSADFGEVIK